MLKVLGLLLVCCIGLSGCRYWVLYEFADQFCEFEEYVEISWEENEKAKQVKIGFHEPVLNRYILLRYLNAAPFNSVLKEPAKTQKQVYSRDEFAIRQVNLAPNDRADPFQFTLTYHPLDEHALLENAYLDTRLSQLFSPALVEPILRSLCSDDYDLSLKQLDMRFQLSTLPKQSLPSLHELNAVFGSAEHTTTHITGEQSLRYTFDFVSTNQQRWQVQQKPIIMQFDFDSNDQLKNLYIHYHKYSYWLDVDNLSGRLLVIRRE